MKIDNPDFKNSIIKTIEEEHICPRSRWYFVCKNSLFWLFWVLSVVVGAVAVAVALFVISYSQYAPFEAFHDSFLTFFISTLPYLWIVLFGLMTALAVNNFRHTARGYRHRAWQLVVASMLLSLAGGAVLQLFGFGQALDRALGEGVDMYMSQEKQEKKLWQQPGEGRLLGRQVLLTLAPTTITVFEDSKGARWNMNISELTPEDLLLLDSQHTVRVIGTTTSLVTKQFHACAVIPWMLDKTMKRKELSETRQAFVKRVYQHKDQAEARLRQIEQEFITATNSQPVLAKGRCAKIVPVRRVEANMR